MVFTAAASKKWESYEVNSGLDSWDQEESAGWGLYHMPRKPESNTKLHWIESNTKRQT